MRGFLFQSHNLGLIGIYVTWRTRFEGQLQNATKKNEDGQEKKNVERFYHVHFRNKYQEKTKNNEKKDREM